MLDPTPTVPSVKTLAQVLTLWLTGLFMVTMPVSADECCAPKPCCPAGACQCHISIPTDPASTPATSAVLPVPHPAVQLAILPSDVLTAVRPEVIPTWARSDAESPRPPVPLYSLTHAYLI